MKRWLEFQGEDGFLLWIDAEEITMVSTENAEGRLGQEVRDVRLTLKDGRTIMVRNTVVSVLKKLQAYADTWGGR